MSTEFPQYRDYTPTGSSLSNSAPNPGVGSSYANPTVPGLGLMVTPAERERAQGFLAEAYADGRLTEPEFDQRLEQVLTANTRRDLNAAFYGLVQVPSATSALGLHPAYRPTLVNQGADGRTGRAAAAIAHFSVFFAWIFGPLFMYAISSKGSYARQQAAKAFNYQTIASIGFVGAIGVNSFLGERLDWMVGMLWVAWLVITLIGGVKAAHGEQWQNPLTRVIPWKPLKEEKPRP
ncbi:DUF1707 and DUF4870 domain-containing protein [Enemella evansiae]|uniref:DUF1707 domain-containing protein n=1 Tax=Enemella evansiae TaxID=2016499 RepID=A0A255GIZ2_9ACTN|nr:DUF1707 and DUF4870 domain-containing protein [Enemella evansiae]PFG67675.1 putative Tic20 family protein [Propionibacteriaceae bacterium ES.041]OYN94610.1 hypothetical protein CGZ96_17185 [Enemella evansiae]OYO01139.1 hypothetical protein CGZ97_16945 [Enemella evansiae]OYO05138.1 hypothetical protein CGZ95_02285 [Enemella evansiae]OYO07604.1 hypothetical protein CGZ98_19435 [Enemella evansiae]